jgi:hypothetical protein
VDPLGKMFPNIVLGKKPPGLDVVTKGKPPHGEKLAPRDIPLGSGVLTQGNLKLPDVLLPLDWLGKVPKPLGILHPKGTPTPDVVGLLIGLVEVEGVPLPMLKSKLGPH